MIQIDMEKPNHCLHCPMCNGNDDCVLIQEVDTSWDWDEQYANCPLQEVKPHGRLIDADVLMNRIKQIEYNTIMMRDTYPGFRCDAIEWWCVEDLVNKSPTIFEEEE